MRIKKIQRLIDRLQKKTQVEIDRAKECHGTPEFWRYYGRIEGLLDATDELIKLLDGREEEE